MSEKCEQCNGTGWYGDNGPGIRINGEYVACDCGAPPLDEQAQIHLHCNTRIAELEVALRDCPTHEDLDAAVFEANGLKAKLEKVTNDAEWRLHRNTDLDNALAKAEVDKDRLAECLRKLLNWAEGAEEQIEGEWGSLRSLEELEIDGELSTEIVEARAALAVTTLKGRNGGCSARRAVNPLPH